jgi:hypothetical protein
MIKKWNEYVNESKLFIYHRQFRVQDLINSGIYKEDLIKKWMQEYNCDVYAHCLFVTEKPASTSDTERMVISRSSRDIANKISFSKDVKKFAGWMPSDSLIQQGDDSVYLYIFKKNSNPQSRARQLHGFIYEGEIRRLNGLDKLKKTHKWDAEGSLNQSYLNYRISQGKKLEFFDNKSYKTLTIPNSISGIDELDDTVIPEEFFAEKYWSIKCMQNATDIELGDFKRISGIEKDGSDIKILPSTTDSFMFAVSFHDGTAQKNILEEYIILMSVENWKKYLPNITEKLSDIKDMYNNLGQFRLKGARTEDSEKAWWDYINTYKKICDGSAIKLRFKRDSKGQLRIQCSFSYNIFKSLVLKTPHIKIS